MRIMLMLAQLVICSAVLLVAGCGSGGDFTPIGGAATPAQPSGPAVAIDLTTGQMAAATTAPAAAAGSVHFLRSPGGTGAASAADVVTAAPTVGSATVASTVGAVYLASTELTQAQWATLVQQSGTTVPQDTWTTVASQIGANTGATRPAFGMSYDQIAAVLAGWNARHEYRLRIPTAAEWERACRAGSSARYAWGDDAAEAAGRARVRDTSGGTGPGVVGSLAVNALGFADLHGNVWEWVLDIGGLPHLRGGSWSDNVLSAAAGNSIDMHPSLPCAIAGVRLVLEAP